MMKAAPHQPLPLRRPPRANHKVIWLLAASIGSLATDAFADRFEILDVANADITLVTGMSSDGSVISVIGVENADTREALTTAQEEGRIFEVLGRAVSGPPDRFSSFQWTIGSGLQQIQSPDGLFFAEAISGDGTTIVGYVYDYNTQGLRSAFWSQERGLQVFDPLSTEFQSTANDVSFDGAVIVGTLFSAATGRLAYRWEENHGVEIVGPRQQQSSAVLVSDDGNTIVLLADIVSEFDHTISIWREGQEEQDIEIEGFPYSQLSELVCDEVLLGAGSANSSLENPRYGFGSNINTGASAVLNFESEMNDASCTDRRGVGRVYESVEMGLPVWNGVTFDFVEGTRSQFDGHSHEDLFITNISDISDDGLVMAGSAYRFSDSKIVSWIYWDD